MRVLGFQLGGAVPGNENRSSKDAPKERERGVGPSRRTPPESATAISRGDRTRRSTLPSSRELAEQALDPIGPTSRELEPSSRPALFALDLRVPTLPSIVPELAQLIDDPGSGPQDVGRKLAGNAPLAGQVLQLANSSAYGLQERCNTVEQACAVLGLRVLCSVVVHACVLHEYGRLGRGAIDLEDLWRHSLRTAQVCALLARNSTSPMMLRPDDAYLCGLLHDIGQVVLLDSLGERYARVHARAKREHVSLDVVEQEELGFDHAQVGGLVLGSWGFGPVLQATVRLHHARCESEKLRVAVLMIAKANLIVGLSDVGHPGCVEDVLDATSLRVLGLPERTLDVLRQYLERES